MKRPRQIVRFSLFAFQDIITGLCGVLILLVMLMLVDFASSPESATAVADIDTDESISVLRREVAELEIGLAKARRAARDAIVSVK